MKELSDDIRLKSPKGKKRSPLWREERRRYLRKSPSCKVCGSHKKVEVHHKIPFYLRPDLELKEENYISLCESKKTLNCHLIIGHGGNYRDYNPQVERDAEHFYDLLHTWQAGGEYEASIISNPST